MLVFLGVMLYALVGVFVSACWCRKAPETPGEDATLLVLLWPLPAFILLATFTIAVGMTAAGWGWKAGRSVALAVFYGTKPAE